MADIGHRLLIKFGLVSQPTTAQQEEWARISAALIRNGVSVESAGDQAARQVFRDYGRMGYKSEADTIEMLLRIANNK